ncbi:hypothetical protein [Actinophytocola sp.]|uniref:hypothetical protein n=1 Tax=Actinophytocola sp. TaxID=1872138 RepID=UPI002ED15BB1
MTAIGAAMGAAMGAFAGSMKQFAAAAAGGQFAVSPEGGDALLKAIRDMARWVDDNLIEGEWLAQQLPLGSSHGAEAMKPYLVQVATDDQGFIPKLREFRSTLADAEQGIMAAMENYDNTDQGARGNFSA